MADRTYPWRTDLENIPRGKMVESTVVRGGKEVVQTIFKPEKVIIACQGFVTLSRWLPPQDDRPNGRWEMLATSQEPEAFIIWPEYPWEILGGENG